MSKTDFTTYLNSYEKRSPSWVERVQKTGSATPGFSKENEKLWDVGNSKLSEETNPKTYQALKDECEFRGVEMPACYIDDSGWTVLGRAFSEDYSLLIDSRAEDMFTPNELRALMAHELKHLYQPDFETSKDSHIAEFDSDRAAIESTDYDTIRSYVDKAIGMMIDEKVPIPAFRKLAHKIHETFPGLIAESFTIETDKWHPSSAERMSAMRGYAQELEDKENGLER